jgi:putative transposase
LIAGQASPPLGYGAFCAQPQTAPPVIVKLWDSAWAEFVPFLAFDKEIRTLICTTNAIESLNARFRRSVKACGHFPTEQPPQAPLPRHPRPDRRGRQRWSNCWKAALNAFDITSDDSLTAGRK